MPAEEQEQEAASVLDQKADAVSRMYPASSSSSSTSTSTSTSTKQQQLRSQDEALGGDQTSALGGTRSQCPGPERGEKPESRLQQHESNEEAAGG